MRLAAVALLLGLLLGAPARADEGKLFAQAKDAFGRNEYLQTVSLCWRYLQSAKPGAGKVESAQFFLAAALEKLGYNHGAVEYYFQVANARQNPELLPRALRALEAISLEKPFDERLVRVDVKKGLPDVAPRQVAGVGAI